MGVYVKGNPKEGEYKLIKTTDGFVLDGKDIAYACIEIDREDEKAVLFLLRMRKAMREGKNWREFLDEERRADDPN